MATGALHPYGCSLLLRNTFWSDDTMLSDSFLALTRYPPVPSDDGLTIYEPGDQVTDTDYARQAYPFVKANWELTDEIRMSNVTPITFPVPTKEWGYVSGWGLCSAETGGELIASGSFTVGAYVVAGGKQVRIASGGLQIVLLGGG